MTMIVIYCVGFFLSAFILSFLNTVEAIPDGVYEEIKFVVVMLWPLAILLAICLALLELFKLFFMCIEAIFK